MDAPPRLVHGCRGGRAARPAFIYHLGDSDPSGENAAEVIERELREYAPGAEIHFERLAVTREQIRDWRLPSRPTKTSDMRAAAFGNRRSVELGRHRSEPSAQARRRRDQSAHAEKALHQADEGGAGRARRDPRTGGSDLMIEQLRTTC